MIIERVVGVRLDIEGSSGEDAERAEKWADELLSEARGSRDLVRDLRAFAEDTPSVRVALLVESDEANLSMVLLANAAASQYLEVTRTESGLAVTGRAELVAVARALEERRFERVGTAQKIVAARERERLTAVTAAARAAIGAEDVPAMCALLRAKDLAGTRATAVRAEIARALVAKPRPEAAEELLSALRDESPSVAHLIGYRLYVQTHLARRLLVEIEAAWTGRPRSAQYLARLVAAVREWPDFPYPAGWQAAADPNLAKALDPHEHDKRTKLSVLIETTVAALEQGRFDAYRITRERLREAKPTSVDKMHATFAARVHAALRGAWPLQLRAAAYDLLVALGEAPATLAPLLADFPAAGGVRAARIAAGLEFLPPAPLRAGIEPPSPAVAWQDVRGAVPTARGWLVLRPGNQLALLDGDALLWKTEAPTDAQLLGVLGDPEGRAFVTCSDGLITVALESGRELWCCGAIDLPVRTGSVVDPQAMVWATPGRLVVVGSQELTVLDPRTGRILSVLEIPFVSCGLQADGEGVLVLDDTRIFDAIADRDRAPSGLFVGRDLRTEDRFVPAVLGSVIREADGVRADFSAVDVVLTGAAGTRRYALPEFSHLGPIVRDARGDAHATLFVQEPGSFTYGAGSWQGLPLIIR